MILNYTLTKDELINFHKKHILNSKSYKKFSSNLKKLYTFLSLLIWLLVQYDIKFKVFISLIAIGVLLFIFRKKIYLYKFENQLNRIYSDYKKKYLFNPIKITFNSDGITLDTSMNDELIKWTGVKDFCIVDNSILIRTFTKDNIFIPSSSIKSNEELNSLKDLFIKCKEISPMYIYPKDMEFIIN